MVVPSLALPGGDATTEAILAARRGAAVRRPRAGRTRRRSRSTPTTRRGRADLPAPRRDPARDRARGGARADDDAGRDRRPASTSGSGCSPAGSRTAVARHQTLRAGGRLVLRPARPTRAQRCSTASPCSPAASPSTPPRRSSAGDDDRAARRARRARRSSSTSRWSSPTATSTMTATGCSRRSASTRANASTTRGDTDAIRRRHATWCAGFVAKASAGMRPRRGGMVRAQSTARSTTSAPP